jgi:hypothetical protein
LVPLIVTDAAGAPMAGVNPVIDGEPRGLPTVNDVLLVAEPVGLVTAIGPVLAPEGTVATICVAVE